MLRSHTSVFTGPWPRTQIAAEAAAGFSVRTDPPPISPASRSLCKANNIANSQLNNDSVSTGAVLLWTVADHIPSVYLEGAALRYTTLCPYRSIWETSRNHTRRRPKAGLCAEIVCRQSEEQVGDQGRQDVDTSPTPVCPLLPHNICLLMHGRM